MNAEAFDRIKLILSEENFSKLKKAHVAIFGIGGVGGYAAEFVARCGIENITIVDDDKIEKSNLNRQIIALNSTIGAYKVDVMKSRILDINKNAKVEALRIFFDETTCENFVFDKFTYVIDAIDSIRSKALLIKTCKNKNIKIISAMGVGNKIEPSMLKLADISETSVCPLARILRKQLKLFGITEGVKVVYSKEEPIKIENNSPRKIPPGSLVFVPAAAGALISSEVIKYIVNT